MLYNIDVPDDQRFTVEGEAPAITCPECLAAQPCGA
jgi:hypothetical protein